MAEVVFRIVLHEEVCIGLIRIHIKGLIGCHNDPCIFDRVTPSRSSSIRAKESLHSAQSLSTELITVANKEGAPHMSGVSNLFEKVDGDKGLSCPCCKGEQGPFRFTGYLASCYLFEDSPDCGILIISACALTAGIRCQERFGRRGIEAESFPLFITDTQVIRRWKLRQRSGGAGNAGKKIVFNKLMAIRREDEGNIDSFADGISLCLLKAMTWREPFSLCLNKCNCHGLTFRSYLDTKAIINPPLRPAMCLTLNDLNCSFTNFTLDMVFCPPPCVDGRVN